MTQQPVDEKKILDYLLGILPEAETESLDGMSLADDDFAARLSAVENDLVDAYARGELTGDALAAFRSSYLASPRRHEKAAFAETFLDMAQDRPAPRLLSQAAASSVSVKYRRSRFTPAQWAIAAAVSAMLLTGGYLIVQNAGLRRQMAQAQAEQRELRQRERDLQGRLERQRSSSDETAEELARVQERLKQLELQAPGNGSIGPDVQLIAFNLAPQGRSISNIPSLSIPMGTSLVVLSLELEVNDFPLYQAALKDPRTGEISWRGGKVRAEGQMNSLLVALPAAALKSQIYVLELSGIPPGGASEIVSAYPFRAALH